MPAKKKQKKEKKKKRKENRNLPTEQKRQKGNRPRSIRNQYIKIWQT